MKRLTLLCVLALGFVLPVRGDDTPAKVPFDLLSTQHMYIKAKINGQGPFNFIFDTGAPFTLLNNRVAKETGVVPKDHKGPTLPVFGFMPAFKIKNFAVGELKVDDLPVMVMDHPTVMAISKAMQPTIGPIDGIVGLSFFARYKLSIDYQAKEMTFVRSTFVPGDTMSKMMATMMGGKAPPKVILAPAAQWGFRVAKTAKDEEPGVDVHEVLTGSPAAVAGLKAGDRLLTLDGRWTDTVADCFIAAGFVGPGQTARLLVKRNGKEIELSVKVQSGL